MSVAVADRRRLAIEHRAFRDVGDRGTERHWDAVALTAHELPCAVVVVTALTVGVVGQATRPGRKGRPRVFPLVRAP